MTDFTSYASMADEADKYCRELETWMRDHGPGSKKPWPEINVANKQRRLAWASKISELCRRAAEKQERASA
jgi:hypothetical protein